jgi:hypothetical protein
VTILTEHELRLLLLAPALTAVDPRLPALAWASMHGDRAALEEMLALLGALPGRQASRVWGLLWFRSAGCAPAPRCGRCGAPADGKGNCRVCDRGPRIIPLNTTH